MARVKANNIDIEYDTFGDPSQKPLLLIMGLGAQMTRWREGFCTRLVDQGHYVIRFDNRDVGLSHKFDHAGVPNMGQVIFNLQNDQPIDAPYNLNDMADDAAGLLDALGIERAHVCGASMGGMIAQTMAVRRGHRLHTLTSIMSSTGNPDLPPAEPDAYAALLTPTGKTLEENMERWLGISKVIGSPAYPEAEESIRFHAKSDYERSFYPLGAARQFAAVAASGNRKPALAKVKVPTLVIHGDKDPLVPLAGGLDTHEAIPGATLKIFEGMGHDLPEPLWEAMIESISSHTARHQAS